jgi:ABC-type tungstate transport system permease subunit
MVFTLSSITLNFAIAAPRTHALKSEHAKLHSQYGQYQASTEQPGFFAHGLPVFESQNKIHVRVVAVGTGQALKIGERGNADALLVHHPAGEEKFIAEGHGIDRRPVMFNDFITVGPIVPKKPSNLYRR